MEKFLKAAAIAWNPIGEVRRRMESETLTVGSVLVPFLGIVITCNLFTGGAQKFFFESLFYQLGGALPAHPLITSGFAQRFMSALGILVPVAAVSMLPAGIFYPSGRNETASTILVVAAASAFYGAAIGVPVYFFSGALATVNPELALGIFSLLSILMIIAIVCLVLFFWVRVTLSVLGLSLAQVIGISVVVIITEALMAGFFMFIAMGSA